MARAKVANPLVSEQSGLNTPDVCAGERDDMSEDTILNIGILHVPANCSTLASLASPNRLATLTLLPPELHISSAASDTSDRWKIGFRSPVGSQ
jgi:hypothetical protein